MYQYRLSTNGLPKMRYPLQRSGVDCDSTRMKSTDGCKNSNTRIGAATASIDSGMYQESPDPR